jgi:peptide/nickel transport system permease protein
MLRFLLARLFQAAISLFIVTLLVFGMMYRLGDPVATLLPPTATERDRRILREELGLDRPLHVQYGMFVSRLSRGDLGHSYYHGRPVVDLLRERLPATLELAVISLLLSLLLGVPLGILAGARPDHWLARAAMAVSMLGISLPTFWLGLLLIMGFAVSLEWLPPMGRGPTRELFGVPFSFLTRDGWTYLVLPAVTLALHHIAMLIRLVRSELFETLRLPFIRAARSRGLSEASIVGRHAMRNSMIPLLTVTAVEFGQLIAFSVVTETIFQWPGLGKLLIDSVYVDRPLVVAYLAMTGVLFLTLNFLVDVAYVFADPRILHGRGEALS